MELDKELIAVLFDIDWFSNCGKDITLDGVSKSKTISAVKKSIQSIRYENILLGHYGEFTSDLFRSHRESYNKWWNVLVNQFKTQYTPELKKIWESKLEPLGLNETCVVEDISFNILNLAVIEAYKDQIPLPPFYQKMLSIFKSGCLVCGWKGKKDDGNFIVY